MERWLAWMPISELFGMEWSRNPKKHDISAIRASMRRWGFTSPLVFDEGTQRLVAGHGRLEAAAAEAADGNPLIEGLREDERGWLLPVIRGASFENESEAEAYLIADNGLTIAGGWDDEKVSAIIRDLHSQDVPIAGLGLDDAYLQQMLKEPKTKQEKTEDVDGIVTRADALQKKWKTKTGQIWVCGSHRIACGDSTDMEVLKALVGNRRVAMVLTDPPYGVSYSGAAGKVHNDDAEGLPALLDAALGNALKLCKKGGVWYVYSPAGPEMLVFFTWLVRNGVFRQTLVWEKDSLVLGHSDFHYRHETIFYGWKPGAAHRAPPDRKQDSVWVFPRPKTSEEHPTTKPVEMFEYALSMSSVVQEHVLDPFSGSGTTLIACERTNRRALVCELSPAYVAVALERWSVLTGLQPKLEKD